MGVYVCISTTKFSVNQKYGGQDMNKHYAIIDLSNGEWVTTIDGEVIVYESRELCDKYIVSVEDPYELEDQYSIIDVTKLINKYI